MDKYHMELLKDEADLIVDVVNRGIDAHLQGVTDSTFKLGNRGIHGNRFVCDVSPSDLGVIIRRLLESDDDTIEMAENLVYSIVDTLGIDEIWLCTDDRFYITLHESCFEDFELLAYTLDLPYISVFDDGFWPTLFNQFDEDGE